VPSKEWVARAKRMTLKTLWLSQIEPSRKNQTRFGLIRKENIVQWRP
jgi:hypothetical protein